MVKYKVLKTFSTKQENRQFYPSDEPVEFTIKRAEEIESDIAGLKDFENYGPVLERIEEPKEETKASSKKQEVKAAAKADEVVTESAEK